jgi:lambda family phage tail tape measure protein
MSGLGVNVDFNANLTRFTSALDRATQDLNKFQSNADRVGANVGKSFATLGAGISVAGIVQFGKAVIGSLDVLNDVKDATGASIENISALEDIAARTGTKFETVSAALIKFNAALKEAKPDNEIGMVLKSIGVNAEELKRIDPAEALRRTAVALSKFADDGNKARAVQELFDKSIKDAAPFLKDLAENGALNATVLTKQAEEAEKFNKEISKFQKNALDASRGIANELLPAMNGLIEKFRTLNQERSLGDMVKKFAFGGIPRMLFGDTFKTDEETGRASSGKIKYPDEDQPKPVLKVPNVPKKKEIDDPTKKLLDNSIKDLERSRNQEAEILASRNKFLELYNNENLISFRDYFAARKAAQQENVDNSIALIDKEIKALELYRFNAKKDTDKAEATGKINESLEKRAKLQRDASGEAISLGLQEGKALENLGKQIRGVGADLLDLQGKAADAARIRLDDQFKPLMDRFAAEGDGTSTKLVEQLKAAQIAQAEFNQAATASSQLMEQLRNTEERLAITRSTGAITELEYLQRISEARADTAAKLEAEVEAQERLGQSSGLKNLQLQAEAARLAMDQLRSQTDLVGLKFKTIFEDSFSNPFADFITGAQTASEAFKSFANSVMQQIARMASQALAQQIFGSLFASSAKGYQGAAGVNGSGSVADFYAMDSASAKGNVFSNGGLVSAFAKGGAFTNSVVSSPTLFKYGKGGSFGLMGEAGPEAIMPLKRGADGSLGVQASGGGGVTVNVINQNGSQVDVKQRQTGDGIQLDVIVRQLEGAMADNIAHGTGPINEAFQGRYGLRPAM